MLKFACTTFDHNDQAIHDIEVQAGVVESLSIHLTRAVDGDCGVKEAERLCKLLVLVLRCSDNALAELIQKTGATLIPTIFHLIKKQTASKTESKYAEHLTRRLASVEISLQRVTSYQDILTLLMDTMKSTQNAKNTMMNHALSVLAGLTLHNDSNATVMTFTGLFRAVVDIAYSSEVVESRYQSAKVLRNLAWHVKNRATMGKTSKCIASLVAMSDSIHKNLQNEALTALQLLSIEYENKAILIANAEGKLLKSVMDAIDTDAKDNLRFQALGILLNLVSRETFKSVGSKGSLINSLAKVSTSPHEPDSTAALAAQCIKRMATYARVKDKCHEDILRAIIRMSNSESKSVMHWAAKALLDQSVVSSNGFYVVRDQDAMKSIVHLVACAHNDVKEPALETVVNLAEQRSNAKKLASNDCLMGELVSIIDDNTDGDNTIIKQHAVRVILSLASHRSSTKRIAKHLGLVRALSRYGISAQDNDVELKRAALHGVVVLAPFL